MTDISEFFERNHRELRHRTRSICRQTQSRLIDHNDLFQDVATRMIGGLKTNKEYADSDLMDLFQITLRNTFLDRMKFISRHKRNFFLEELVPNEDLDKYPTQANHDPLLQLESSDEILQIGKVLKTVLGVVSKDNRELFMSELERYGTQAKRGEEAESLSQAHSSRLKRVRYKIAEQLERVGINR